MLAIVDCYFYQLPHHISSALGSICICDWLPHAHLTQDMAEQVCCGLIRSRPPRLQYNWSSKPSVQSTSKHQCCPGLSGGGKLTIWLPDGPVGALSYRFHQDYSRIMLWTWSVLLPASCLCYYPRYLGWFRHQYLLYAWLIHIENLLSSEITLLNSLPKYVRVFLSFHFISNCLFPCEHDVLKLLLPYKRWQFASWCSEFFLAVWRVLPRWDTEIFQCLLLNCHGWQNLVYSCLSSRHIPLATVP